MITAESVVDVCCEPLHKLRLENELIRVYWVDLAPGVATQFHRHERPCAGICVGDSKIRNEVVGKETVVAELHDGDVIYTPGKMSHRIENIGPGVFQNVTMEVLRTAGHKTSSLKRLEHELHGFRLLVDAPTLRVAQVELAADERFELVGDHLVVWLRGEATAATFEVSRALQHAGDFAWCCGVATVESVRGTKISIVEIV